MQRCRIVAAGLCIAHTATNGADILVFHIDIDRIQTGSIVRTGRRQNNHEQIVFARVYAQERIHCKNKRTNVQGCALCVGNPVLFHRDEFLQALETQLFRQFRNNQTLVGAVQTLEVFVRAEQLYTAVSTAISLQTLENSLTVVQAHCRRAEGNVAVRHNYRIVPALSLIIGHYQHMVSEDMTESQLALVLGFFFRTSRQLFFDFHVKNLFFDSFAANRCAVGRL